MRILLIFYATSYLYIDWIILEALKGTKLKCIAFTYDIWCKFQVNFEKRVRQYFDADVAKAFLALARRGFIPKLHLYAHGSACATRWSLNYHQGVG
jgi:hypothetical protein